MSADSSPCRLLIVDDSSNFRLLVKMFLRDWDLHLLFAADSIQAMRLALREKPDLLLLDIDLPGGDGLNLLERLRVNSQTRDVRVVVTTGLTSATLEAKAKRLGVRSYLPKPITKERLREAVQEALQGLPCSPTPQPAADPHRLSSSSEEQVGPDGNKT